VTAGLPLNAVFRAAFDLVQIPGWQSVFFEEVLVDILDRQVETPEVRRCPGRPGFFLRLVNDSKVNPMRARSFDNQRD